MEHQRRDESSGDALGANLEVPTVIPRSERRKKFVNGNVWEALFRSIVQF